MAVRRWSWWWCSVGVAASVALASCGGRLAVPPLPAGAGPTGAVRSATGVLVTSLGSFDGGTWVRTPCHGVTVLHQATPVDPVEVVLDPGHGGDEDGTIGANGLREKDLNLAVAQRVAGRLEAAGRAVALTRDRDVRQLIRTRSELAMALEPAVIVSIHHNSGGGPGRRGRPGSEVYHQAASADGARLARGLWTGLTGALDRYGIAWTADDTRPGVRIRLDEDGAEYYGLLRGTGTIPTVITEAAFLSNPAEAELLARSDVQDVEAAATAEAIDRFLDTRPASETDTPVTTPGTAPGTTTILPARPPDADGCVDPPLE